MKIHRIVFTCLALAGTTFAADNSDESSGLKLSLHFPTNTFVSGRPIHATVVLENTTTNSMAVPFVRNSSIELFVLNQNKEPLTATNRMIWHTYSGPSSILLPVKKPREYQYELTEIFDLSIPGKYYIRAKGVKFKGPWEKLPAIESAIGEITIVPTQN